MSDSDDFEDNLTCMHSELPFSWTCVLMLPLTCILLIVFFLTYSWTCEPILTFHLTNIPTYRLTCIPKCSVSDILAVLLTCVLTSDTSYFDMSDMSKCHGGTEDQLTARPATSAAVCPSRRGQLPSVAVGLHFLGRFASMRSKWCLKVQPRPQPSTTRRNQVQLPTTYHLPPPTRYN